MFVRRVASNFVQGNVDTYVGHFGELFYDPTTTTLHISDGQTPGGILLTSGGGQTSTNSGITAASMTAITSQVSVVTTVASGTSVQLVAPVLNMEYRIINRGANSLLVYPPNNARFEANSTNGAVSITINGMATFIMTSSTQGYVY